MCDSRKALLRSQGGRGVGLALLTCPVNRLTTFTSQLFRVVLLRRLHVPFPLAVRNCSVAITVQLVCVLGFWEGEVGPLRTLQRGSAAKQGAATNVLVRAPHVDDARRLEVVVDGLPLFG